MKLIPPVTLRKDVMNMEDDDGLDSCKGDNSARADLQIPLLELSTPITLRLADGDSSSCLTHRTVPLQLHIGKHVETATFYETPQHQQNIDLPLTPDSISTPTDLSPINCSLSDSISLGSMQADMYPFVKVSPVSDISVPPDILSNFSLLFPRIEVISSLMDMENSIARLLHFPVVKITRQPQSLLIFSEPCHLLNHNSSRTSTFKCSYPK
ncbi:hypothetical protein BASA83_006616 [Batrachochytrium salamandrivorans]|nr:hypothetical protein BASA83_006616 [Batrachochytrium salamandrivorans]